MANRIPRVPVREQDPAVRAHNFDEVCYGYSREEALLEATRCLNCKNPRCVSACPVGLKIPVFISKLVENDIPGQRPSLRKTLLCRLCAVVCARRKLSVRAVVFLE